ncbi:DUF2309 domain-containing protein [Halarchaeum nitratireducens]|uniref:Probable inorganic carbon transporter subunit DabA n=1 Tax=Halarchaeum nitratireducens TaxID=489913 RepID=A0A830GC67_9EURY|nr:DUF2309 domain-containing protein [Halarchaeum nitratireducens]GGN16345.1 UPF0753 protein [Halarchaeum nitratireducens]
MSTDTTHDTDDVRERISDAAETVGTNWPLHSFVTANPLAGYEDRPFHEAVERATTLRGGRAYPDPDTFRAAWERGDIDPSVLRAELDAHGYSLDPEAALDRLADAAGDDARTVRDEATARVDHALASWLAAFCDEGEASWPMPNREAGFYDAFRAVARHDSTIPDAASLADAPDDPAAAIADVLADHPGERLPAVFEAHLNALPGWTGLLKYRAERGDEWQDAYPITLVGYLAARLLLAERFDAPIDPLADAGDETDANGAGAIDGSDDETDTADDGVPLAEVWLRAWEQSYRGDVVDAVADASAARADPADDGSPDGRADAQLVFCIDTRSEVFRRHLEATGDYETHGYAGFFGVPMRYEGYDEASADACPPIVDAEHHVHERPDGARADEHAIYDRWTGRLRAAESVLKAVKSNAATAFSFVESAGSAYGAALAARTLAPERVHDLRDALDDRLPSVPDFCTPSVEREGERVGDLPVGMTHEERVAYAAAAFETMEWDEFARLVVFTGHASETTNNPFEASLDCGACAGNPGGPNARVLAAICNDDAVRDALGERGIDVPDDTVFLAAEHNTTTDEVTLYDGAVPESHERDVERLRSDLDRARSGAAAERAESMGADPERAVRDAERRAADWAETRPEWGLAGNAAFVIGPRDLTADLDLGGRAFLHSYDWTQDREGDALDAIFAGPVVVTQWINAQYYCATVDNAAYGSGSKITHNPVGNVGVYQGNGGDLVTGLPLQSLMAADDDPHHQPLRLSLVVHAPVERVRGVLAQHEHVRTLCENGWLSLTVVDPTRGHDAYAYDGGFTLDEPEDSTAEREPEREPDPEARVAVADD